MNKGHISPLLADYIDGILPPDEAADVKEHLARCAACREEHRFMKAYRKETAAFPTVPVPGDFLEKIHARIDAPAPRGLVRTLFFPLRIKLPLEAAGALALTVLAVFIFRPFGERGTEYRAEAPAVSEKAAMPGEKTDDRAPARGGDMLARSESGARARRKAAHEEMESPARTEEITVTNGAEGAKTAATTDKAEQEETADMSIVLVASRAGSETPGTSGALKKKDTRADMITSLQQKGAQGESSADMSRAAEPPSKNQARVDVIVNQAWALGGRVLRVGDEDASGSRRLIIVEIPAKSYARFMTAIRGSWIVRKQSPAAPPARAGLLRLTMSLSD
jgi:anti-sigma factor RsiW